jgi:hypothetical protein
MCGLFYDYFSTADNVVVNGMTTNDEFEKIWKKRSRSNRGTIPAFTWRD